jgi:peptidoglycan/LPS O-acetylase OafA/YrhL
MRRLSQLDGIRGIAILLVVVWHYLPCQVESQQRAVQVAMRALRLTWSGVDLFFVLSGFLIAGILLDNRDASNYYRVFYRRRVCRIFPLYFLVLGLFVCLSATSLGTDYRFAWLFANPMPLWSYATFSQNILMGINGNFGANWLAMTWSLAVEEQFYLVIPLLVAILPRRGLLYLFLIAIAAAPILRATLPGFWAFVNTPWRADSLLSGACLAVLVRWGPFLAFVRRHAQLVFGLFVLFLAGAAVITWRSPHVIAPLKGLWLAALYSLFVLLAVALPEGRISRSLSNPLLVWFGTLSYGIYMFHQAVAGLLYGFIRGSGPTIKTPTDVGITALAFVVTLAIASLSYYAFERPILRYGHRLIYSVD